MTDKEDLEALLTRFGLGFENAVDDKSGQLSVTLNAHRGNVEGYTSFFMDFYFHPDGSFEAAGIWE